MRDRQYFKNKLFGLSSEEDFARLAIEVFQYQAVHNEVYRGYLDALGVRPAKVGQLSQIPFLPISFFKSHKVLTGNQEAEMIFTSSGTSGQGVSRHFVADPDLYRQSFLRAFKSFYGDPKDYCILALLPTYLEREGSSLIYMAEELIHLSGDADSGFYLDEWDRLASVVSAKLKDGQKVLLLGVTFALLDFSEKFSLPAGPLTVMETGGMKGRRQEMLRAEVHEKLKTRLGVQQVHSEYGMTELLSQAYSHANGHFYAPAWMKVLIRQTDDPFGPEKHGRTGGINVIDLANLDSCCFVETQDLGRLHPDASFEVMGRFDNSDIRGCNLMMV